MEKVLGCKCGLVSRGCLRHVELTGEEFNSATNALSMGFGYKIVIAPIVLHDRAKIPSTISQLIDATRDTGKQYLAIAFLLVSNHH